MKIAGTYERLQQLIGLVELSPSKEQIVMFLSQHVCPEGELSGISWMELQANGVFRSESTHGLVSRLDPEIKVLLTDDNVVALAARTGKTQMFDMAEMYANFKQATHREVLSHYSSGIVLPIDDTNFVGIVLTGSFEKLKEYSGYFECVRLVLALWRSKIDLRKNNLLTRDKYQTTALTQRQNTIVEMIREGRTNISIASILGYSESLIRQETIIIYRKLGVSGRKQLQIDIDINQNGEKTSQD